MGTQVVHRYGEDSDARAAFMRSLLNDVRALEMMLEQGMIEGGICRIGAEQEMFIVDRSWQPAPLNRHLLELIDDERFTTELGQFNMEFNLPPLHFSGDCFRVLEREIIALVDRARDAASQLNAEIALVGILPTIEKDDLGLKNMTDVPRYHALNAALTDLRGGPCELSIKGIDELRITHESVMLEACNTSFQVHFQVEPSEFALWYNIAQAVTAPVLCAAVNSPMLFGRRLWRETRIALFQQSVDTRRPGHHMRESLPRVSFGNKWVEKSILEIYQEDIARFRALFADQFDEPSVEMVNQGKVPKLRSLCLHNGTVYRWNRPCYGVSEDGKAHLRIENRVLPSGPTPIDEVANAALWIGLINGIQKEYGDITTVMDFDDAAANMLAAARLGLEAQLIWVDDDMIPARELLLKRLIPLAREGLREGGIDQKDIDRYLGVIEARIANAQTGARWISASWQSMKSVHSKSELLKAITGAMVERQSDNTPVHEWPIASIVEGGGGSSHFKRVGQFMTTDLFTVNENDVVDLAASLMDWQHLRHIPVEDNEHRLVGIVSHRALIRYLAQGGGSGGSAGSSSVRVSTIMQPAPITVTPDTQTIDAPRLMRQSKIGCLPVVQDDKLVGIVTEHDFMEFAAPLLEQFLSD